MWCHKVNRIRPSQVWAPPSQATRTTLKLSPLPPGDRHKPSADKLRPPLNVVIRAPHRLRRYLLLRAMRHHCISASPFLLSPLSLSCLIGATEKCDCRCSLFIGFSGRQRLGDWLSGFLVVFCVYVLMYVGVFWNILMQCDSGGVWQ